MIRRPPRSTLLSLHDALPISVRADGQEVPSGADGQVLRDLEGVLVHCRRSEEHTSELQSQSNLVCRLLLEKKKKNHDIRKAAKGRTSSKQRAERKAAC